MVLSGDRHVRNRSFCSSHQLNCSLTLNAHPVGAGHRKQQNAEQTANIQSILPGSSVGRSYKGLLKPDQLAAFQGTPERPGSAAGGGCRVTLSPSGFDQRKIDANQIILRPEQVFHCAA